MTMIPVGEGGGIHSDRIVAIFPAKSEPIRRLLQAMDPALIVNMTYGYPRRAAVLLDSGHVAITSAPIQELLSYYEQPI